MDYPPRSKRIPLRRSESWLARALSASLRWPRERRVIKSNHFSHDGKNGYERLQRQVSFSARVTLGLNYLLVDDFVSHGGTRDSGSASDLNPSPPQGPDFSAALERLTGSIRAWEQLLAEVKYNLVLTAVPPPDPEGNPNQMYSERALR